MLTHHQINLMTATSVAVVSAGQGWTQEVRAETGSKPAIFVTSNVTSDVLLLTKRHAPLIMFTAYNFAQKFDICTCQLVPIDRLM